MMDSTENHSDSFFSKFQILPSVKSSIVIPVKDEQTYILQTLSSFANQVDILSESLDSNQFEILVLANNCSDDSVALIKKFQLEHPHLNIHLQEITLSKSLANIGYIRRKLMESAYSRLMQIGGGIIMTTDGDTSVANDWISQTQQEIINGADVVGGRILLYQNELENLDEFTLLHHFKDEKYQLLIAELEAKIIDSEFDPHPRHHQHFNGSFAITTDCYAKSGGVPEVDYLEDCAFFDRLQTIDAKIRHSYNVKVHTSARWIGRTEIGLSHQLNVWKNLGKNVDNYFVESCPSITQRLVQKRSLLDLWNSKNQITESEFHQKIKKIIPEITIEKDNYSLFNNCQYFGEWFQKLMIIKNKRSKENIPAVSIDTAIKDLQMKIQELSSHDFAQTSIL
ncbi:glycosyltransferase family A protein [Chryseobacterium sp. KACC 21268]|nr:glycosyltransferase family A protein [Chryseobacterium sp. KACC 21268]